MIAFYKENHISPKKKNMSMKLIFSFIVFIAIFGPKFGLFDTSVISSLLGFFILFPLKEIKIPKDGFLVIILIVIIFCYTSIVFLVSETSDLYPVLRGIRALLATILLGIFVYNFPLRISAMLDITIIIILINAIAIFIQILLPQTQIYFSELYGFDKNIRSMRAFGLTAGFDTAGFLCVKGIILSGVSFLLLKKSLKYVLMFAIFGTATLFTSRSSMLLAVVFLISFSIAFIIKSEYKFKLVAIMTIIIIIFALLNYILPLIGKTFNLYTFDSFESKAIVTSQYANNNIEKWMKEMWLLPKEEYNLLFGGSIILTSDVGYIKIIFMIGIVGLLLVVALYFLMFTKVIKIKRQIKPFEKRLGIINVQRVLLISLSIFIPLELITNVKNLYFLTRSHYELTILLFFLALAGLKQIRDFFS